MLIVIASTSFTPVSSEPACLGPRGGCCSATALLSMARQVPRWKNKEMEPQETQKPFGFTYRQKTGLRLIINLGLHFLMEGITEETQSVTC